MARPLPGAPLFNENYGGFVALERRAMSGFHLASGNAPFPSHAATRMSPPIPSPKPVAAFVLWPQFLPQVYGAGVFEALLRRVELAFPPCSAEELPGHESDLGRVQLLFTSWGAPVLEESFLRRLPALRGVFHAAGSVKSMVSEAFWERGLFITSGYRVNAVPVAQFCLAQIILGLKGAPAAGRRLREGRLHQWQGGPVYPGVHGATLGLISLGATARELVRLCQQTIRCRILAYDPYVDPAVATSLGVTLCSLEEVFAQAEVVSLHTPLLPETEGLIRAEHLMAMKPLATFLNTARGAIVDEAGLLQAARQRPDLQILLDVTTVEPLPDQHPLHDLPNVFLTPHLAGAIGRETSLLGACMVEELDRFLAGRPLLHAWSPEVIAISA